MVNGAEVELVRVVFGPHEEGDALPPEDHLCPWELNKMPQYLVVRLLHKGTSIVHDPNLEEGELIIEPTCSSFAFVPSGNDDCLSVNIRRTMFPVESANATSEYKAQGFFSTTFSS